MHIFMQNKKNLEEIGVQMTYCNLDTEEIRRFRETYTRAELKEMVRKAGI